MAAPMEVEGGGGSLKRCSSAPLIGPAASSTTAALVARPSLHAVRRFSGPLSPSSPSSPKSCGGGPRLTPRVSQLRQEECADATNVREVAHERETHSAMQMSQSWEDLTLVPGGNGNGRCGSASPASPSPSRRSFTTRRSLSPIAVRPSCLSPATKRRFSPDEPPDDAKRCRRSLATPDAAPS